MNEQDPTHLTARLRYRIVGSEGHGGRFPEGDGQSGSHDRGYLSCTAHLGGEGHEGLSRLGCEEAGAQSSSEVPGLHSRAR